MYPDEESVKNKLIYIFNTQENSSFVIGAGQNVDRFVAIYKACKIMDKTLIIDPYIAYILKIVGKKSPNLPQVDWQNIMVYNDERQLEKLNANGEDDLVKQIKKNNINYEAYSETENYVYYTRYIKEKLVEHIRILNKLNINIIYSQWAGYLEKEHFINSSKTILEYKDKDYINYHEVHTSGHASKDDILKLVKSIKPKKIVPIHTNHASMFKYYINNHGISTIELWEDNTSYSI